MHVQWKGYRWFGAVLLSWKMADSRSCCFSVTKSWPILCDPMGWSAAGFPVLHYLPEFAHSCPSSQWCHPTISSSPALFSSCPQYFPALGSFPVSQFFISGGQNIGTSASVLPVNIQGWFPLGLTGLISLLSKGFLSAPHFESINSSGLSLLYGPTLTSVHDYWRNHSFN